MSALGRFGAATVMERSHAANRTPCTMALGGTMRSIRRIPLIILLSIGCAAQPPQAKRELDVPYVPTEEAVVAEMLKTAGVKKGDVLYDLGCADGPIVITPTKQLDIPAAG